MKNCFLFLIFVVALASNGRAQSIEWYTLVNGNSYNYGIASDIDASGNVYSVGYSTGTATIAGTAISPNGKGDGFVVKQDKNGNILWGKTFGADDNVYYDEVQDVHVDNHGDCYILMAAKGKNFKYDKELISGIEASGSNGGEGVMLKIDPTGKLLWWEHHDIKRFEAVTTDADKNVYLTGSFYGSGTIGSQTLTNPTSGTTSDLFVAKFTPEGKLLWAKNVGGNVYNSFVHGYDVACAPDGKALYVTGTTSKTAYFETGTLSTVLTNSVFLAKYDSAGTELWARSYDSGKYRNVSSMDVATDGTVALAGSYGYPATLSYSAFYSPDGEEIHNTIYESSSNSKIYCISFNSSGEYFISGYFINDIQLPDTLVTSKGGTGFMAKFNENQEVKWIKYFSNAEWTSNIHQYEENSAILTIRLDYPLNNNQGESMIEPVYSNAVFMKVNEDIKTALTGNEKKETLRAYPNPANDWVHISCDDQIRKIELMDVMGRVTDVVDGGSNEATIDLSHQKPGLYFLIIHQSGRMNQVMKIVKK